MWIIPKTLSAFVPATEGLSLDLEERAWMLESSAMWRSKPSSKPTWLRRLKKGGWITHLSSRILKPSLHQSFEEKFVDSLEDIHASHSVAQGSDKEQKTQDTCGHISESTSGQLDLFGAFGKMSQDTPRWGYGESCPIWKKMVTDARGAYSARKKLALHTKGNECSSWPTASARDHKGGYTGGRIRNGKVSMDTLDVAVQAHTDGGILSKWATPQASDHVEGARTAKESNQKCLGRDLNQMENWPTPTGTERSGTNPQTGKGHGLSKAAKMNWPTPRAGNPGSRKPGTGGKILAEEAKKNWGTPASNDANKTPHCEINSKQGGLSKSVGIEEAKKNWGTPQARDWKGAQGRAYKGGAKDLPAQTEGVPPHNGLQDQEKSNTSGKNHGSPKLNPNWCEQLQGLEVGWTQLPTEWIGSDS